MVNPQRIIGGCLAVALVAVGGLITWASNRHEAERSLPPPHAVASADVVERFGHDLETQLHLPVPTMHLAGLMDFVQIAGRSLPADADPVQRAAFVNGVAQGAAEESTVIEQLHERALAGDRVSFRGVATRDGQPVARFRQIIAGGGVNLFDLLVSEASGQPRIVDFFVLTNGRWQSEVVAELYQRGVAEAPTGLRRVMGARGAIEQSSEQIGQMGTALRANQPEEVLRIYDSLPAEVQRMPFVFGMRMDAASTLDDDARYMAILDEYAALFPDDPNARVRLFDAHFQREKWDEAKTDLVAIRETFDDPYWLGPEAQIELKRGNPAGALELAQQLMREDPTLLEGPDNALLASLALDRPEDAARYAAQLRDQYHVDLAILAGLEGYEAVKDLDVPPPAEALTGGGASGYEASP